MGHPSTKEKILDAAERLFARSGFHRTSLRAITAEAGVNLAAVNYHFGSKDSLIGEVFRRRLRILNGERSRRLEEIRKASSSRGKRPGLEETLRAFIEPSVSLLESEQGKSFVNIVARAMTDPHPHVRRIFLGEMKDVLSLFFDTLCQALPDIPPELLFARFQFMLGAMALTLFNHKKPRWIPERLESFQEEDLQAVTGRLIDFVRAGMEAPGG